MTTDQGPCCCYLSLTEVCARLGLRQNSLTSKSGLPPPDAVIGGVRGWLPSTIDSWAESRPRAGRQTGEQ